MAQSPDSQACGIFRGVWFFSHAAAWFPGNRRKPPAIPDGEGWICAPQGQVDPMSFSAPLRP